MESTKASQGLGQTLYRAAKYLIYGLLTLNIGLFLQEELLSAQHALSDGQNLASLIQLFSATLDTAAWVVLLLLFELETAVIPDEKLVGGRWSVLVDFDEFIALTAANCRELGATALQVIRLDHVIATPAAFESAYDLALVDVINASAWILVVILLEIEVRLQLRGGVPSKLQWLMNGFKVVLYTTLALAAVYWGIEGEFLDFWDAALWLFAFVFIELNVFAWQQELKSQGDKSS